MTTLVKFYKVNAIGKAIKGMDTMRRDLTISALYHGLVHNNVSYMSGLQREDAASFDTCLRKFIPVQWKKEGSFYQFDAKKLAANLTALGLGAPSEYKDDFDSFANIVLEYWNLNNAKAKGQELTDQQAHDKAAKQFPKMLESMYANGLTVTEMETMFIMFKQAHIVPVKAAA